ncbi:PREDICTED: E3 ubiquitin-protein ligase MARCH6 [Nicrophorus vespilloides]|uniref:RING-type E3 ubiquitin transferase n=1 Tax=Nicrophorus vespilloides TaxID=110193 RepID=A0ABM1NHQ5_NICVS|nr:PREDICTED: E3 ubiquitin-protein ligase MARCH6 [Nicrophorus vespilloides]
MMESDICRVCRSEGLPDRPLFHPCICTGSIKWIHQECLMQWMQYSHKEYCELCSHKFSFTPIYSPDMPGRLPLKDLAGGLLNSIATAMKFWLHFTLVAIAWLGIVPITSCRIYRSMFTTAFDVGEMFSTENITTDIFHGCFIVTCTLFSFLGLLWLREQILLGGGPDWLERNPFFLQDLPIIAQEGNPQQENNNVVGNEQQQNPDAAVAAGPALEINAEAGGDAQNGDNNWDQFYFDEDIFGNGENNAAAAAPADANNANDIPEVQPAQPEEAIEPPRDAVDAPNANEENNWIPMEWDRAAEELSWERLLGLDGSLLFLEHIFWVVSLNALFVLIFAFCPYLMGVLFLKVFSLQETASESHFEGLLTTLMGYCLVGFIFLVFHHIAAALRLGKARRLLGLCYIVVKVVLLSVIEIGILPLVCGWWLDICSLTMFDATLKDRETSFKVAPGTSIFIHWLVGMVYVYYFASFVLLLREILRPGVLWFLRNLNDPDFSPIQEMIHLPILRHIRRLLLSIVIFGSAVLLMLYLPIRMLKMVVPTFLPYTIALNNELQVNELSLELLLLQVILPALLEQGHTRTWLKGLVKCWCKYVAWVLDIYSYLLGDAEDEQEQQQQPPAPQVAGGLGAAHQALLMRDGPIGFRPYVRPTLFAARIAVLLVFVCVSLMIGSLVALTVPVGIGRKVMALWLVGAPPPSPQVTASGGSGGGGDEQNAVMKVHELYTAACGTYICWLAMRAVSLFVSWFPQGRAAMMQRLKHWFVLGAKTIAASAVLLGLIPLLFGLLLELVVIVPLRVPLYQTPVFFVWQDWALGVLYTKIACAITMMGPDWALRTAIERVYRDGIRDMNLRFIYREVAAPVVVTCGLALAVPYVIAYSVVPLFVSNLFTTDLIGRRLYPFLLLVIVSTVIVTVQVRQFKRLYEHIKNDKYLVGQRLVNYDHRRSKMASSKSAVSKTTTAAAAPPPPPPPLWPNDDEEQAPDLVDAAAAVAAPEVN